MHSPSSCMMRRVAYSRTLPHCMCQESDRSRGDEAARATIREQIVNVILKQVQQTGGTRALPPVYAVGRERNGSAFPQGADGGLRPLAFLDAAVRAERAQPALEAQQLRGA